LVSREGVSRKGVDRDAFISCDGGVVVAAVSSSRARARAAFVIILRRSFAVREDNRESRVGVLATLPASTKKVPYSYCKEDEKDTGSCAYYWYKRESVLGW
jgi:hypothetical protein